MAFTHGTNAKIYCGGYDLSEYFNSVNVPESTEALETTTFGKTAKTYIPGLHDATLSAEGYFSQDSVNEADIDDVLAAALGLFRIWLYLPAGGAFGARGVGIDATKSSYEIGSEVASVVSVSAEAQSRIGAEPIIVLHALGSETSDDNGAVYDSGAASANGGWYYLISTTAGVSSAILDIEGSADGSTGWASILPSTQGLSQFGRQSLRYPTDTSIPRYVRATWSSVSSPGDDTAPFILALYRA